MDITTRAEWYEEVQGCILYINDEGNEQLLDVLVKVFSRLPENDAFELRNSRLMFLLPTTCFARDIHIFSSKDEHVIWLIVFTTDLLEGSKAEFIYTVAHELAHVFLGHTMSQENMDSHKTKEIAADKQVVKWGFEKELRATPDNYLYGDGIRNVFGDKAEV